MKKASQESVGTKLCRCGRPASTVIHKVIVGESWVTHIDEPICEPCKDSYDAGYGDGLNDS